MVQHLYCFHRWQTNSRKTIVKQNNGLKAQKRNNIMNTKSKALALLAVTLVSIGGSALSPARAQTTGSIYKPAIGVQYVGSLSKGEQRDFESMTGAQRAAVQERLNANPALVSNLHAKGVQLKNVVKIIDFKNGSELAYVR